MIIAVAVPLTPVFARVVRVQTLVVRDAPYVHAAVSLGIPRRAVVARHVVPNVVGPLMALFTMNVGVSILVGSSLSYLGLGPQAPTPEWGAMLSQASNYLQSDWALAVFPGLAVTLTVISVNVIGRDLQARFEGRSLSWAPDHVVIPPIRCKARATVAGAASCWKWTTCRSSSRRGRAPSAPSAPSAWPSRPGSAWR